MNAMIGTSPTTITTARMSERTLVDVFTVFSSLRNKYFFRISGSGRKHLSAKKGAMGHYCLYYRYPYCNIFFAIMSTIILKFL